MIRAALRALGRNKLRTALTLIGITIGISAVICTVAIGEGGSNRIHEQLLMLGDNFVWVEAGGRNVNGVRTGTGTTKTLTLADMKAILQNFPIIALLAGDTEMHRVHAPEQEENGRRVARMVVCAAIPAR